MNRRRLRPVPAILCGIVLLLASCRKESLPPFLVPTPEGTPRSTLTDLSPEAVYSLLEWYRTDPGATAGHKAVPQVVEAEQQAALKRIRQGNAERLERQFPNLISGDSAGSFTFSPTYFSNPGTLQQDYLAVLEQLRKQLLRTGSLAIPAAECQRRLAALGADPGQAFTAWARKHGGRLSLESLGYADKLSELNGIIDCLVLQRRIKDTLSEAAALRRSGDGVKALDLLQALKDNEIGSRSLSPIGDTTTLARLETTLRTLPEQFIQDVLGRYEKQVLAELVRLPADSPADETRRLFLASMENAFSASLLAWHADRRFQPFLENTAELRRKLIRKLADLRALAYQSALRQDAERRCYWQTYQQYLRCRRELQEKKESSYALYALTTSREDPAQDVLARIGARLHAAYLEILARGAECYLGIAEKHSDLTNRHGIALLLARMLQEMFSPASPDNALTPPGLKYQDRIRALERKSLQFIRKDALRQKLVLQDFSSPSPGLGMSYARDLEHVLRRALRNEAAGQRIAIGSQAAAAEEKDYLLYGGVIADYDGSETIERQSIRTVMHYGPVERKDNPEYVADPGRAAAAAQKEPYLYRQERFEQIVRMNEIERLAHLRIFFNLKGPGVNDVIELNEFYSRRFLVEQSHPIDDRRPATPLQGFSSAGMQLSPSGPDVLRNDRVWSAGELLDLARKDSLAMLAMKILHRLRRHPLHLAAEAGAAIQAGDFEKGTELWGICLAATSYEPAPKDPARLIAPEFNPPAKCYQAELKKAEQQQKELQELRNTILPKAFAALNLYLNSIVSQ